MSCFPPPIYIGDDIFEYSSSIPGLYFTGNEVACRWNVGGQSRIDINSFDSHPGGHFVTHPAHFKYKTFGIHLGQLDRLTFVAHRRRIIDAYFIDCRKGMPSCGRRAHLRMADNPYRKLCIPCGVAHTFSNLEEVVTRNDLSIFVDSTNSAWNVVDDDVSFWWTTDGIKEAPQVTTNTKALPKTMVRFFYRLQQHALLSDRENRIDAFETSELLGIKGCYAVPVPTKQEENGANLVVPSVSSCEMDFFLLHLNGGHSHPFVQDVVHDLTHTFLDREGEAIDLEVLAPPLNDLATANIKRITWICNPNVGIRIRTGVHYRYSGIGQFAVREEREILV